LGIHFLISGGEEEADTQVEIDDESQTGILLKKVEREGQRYFSREIKALGIINSQSGKEVGGLVKVFGYDDLVVEEGEQVLMDDIQELSPKILISLSASRYVLNHLIPQTISTLNDPPSSSTHHSISLFWLTSHSSVVDIGVVETGDKRGRPRIRERRDGSTFVQNLSSSPLSQFNHLLLPNIEEEERNGHFVCFIQDSSDGGSVSHVFVDVDMKLKKDVSPLISTLSKLSNPNDPSTISFRDSSLTFLLKPHLLSSSSISVITSLSQRWNETNSSNLSLLSSISNPFSSLTNQQVGTLLATKFWRLKEGEEEEEEGGKNGIKSPKSIISHLSSPSFLLHQTISDPRQDQKNKRLQRQLSKHLMEASSTSLKSPKSSIKQSPSPSTPTIQKNEIKNGKKKNKISSPNNNQTPILINHPNSSFTSNSISRNMNGHTSSLNSSSRGVEELQMECSGLKVDLDVVTSERNDLRRELNLVKQSQQILSSASNSFSMDQRFQREKEVNNSFGGVFDEERDRLVREQEQEIGELRRKEARTKKQLDKAEEMILHLRERRRGCEKELKKVKKSLDEKERRCDELEVERETLSYQRSGLMEDLHTIEIERDEEVEKRERVEGELLDQEEERRRRIEVEVENANLKNELKRMEGRLERYELEKEEERLKQELIKEEEGDGEEFDEFRKLLINWVGQMGMKVDIETIPESKSKIISSTPLLSLIIQRSLDQKLEKESHEIKIKDLEREMKEERDVRIKLKRQCDGLVVENKNLSEQLGEIDRHLIEIARLDEMKEEDLVQYMINQSSSFTNQNNLQEEEEEDFDEKELEDQINEISAILKTSFDSPDHKIELLDDKEEEEE